VTKNLKLAAQNDEDEPIQLLCFFTEPLSQCFQILIPIPTLVLRIPNT